MQYLYNDGDLYNFMNVETFDQIAMDKEELEILLSLLRRMRWLRCFYKGVVFAIEPPLLWSLRLLIQSLVLREIQLLVLQSLQLLETEHCICSFICRPGRCNYY